MLCRVMRVCKSAFYKWQSRQDLGGPRKLKDEELKLKIKLHFEKGRGNYGKRRLQYLLRRESINVSIERISRLMKELELKVKTKRKFKQTTDSDHKLPVAENIVSRSFNVPEPNKVWTSDISVPQSTERGYSNVTNF